MSDDREEVLSIEAKDDSFNHNFDGKKNSSDNATPVKGKARKSDESSESDSDTDWSSSSFTSDSSSDSDSELSVAYKR